MSGWFAPTLNRREFKRHISGCGPFCTMQVPRRLEASCAYDALSDKWLVPEFHRWVEEKRKEAHINIFKGQGFLEITFYYEPHAIEYSLLWEHLPD